MKDADAKTPKRHVLTISLEDYFQVNAFNKLIQRGQWYRFETRLEQNTNKALELLDRFGIKATFFVMGWNADRYPEIVRLVAERGHEIASMGYYHRRINQMTPAEYREDLARAREALEKASGKPVLGYRVAHGWFAPADLWALDVLAEEGYAYDASINPIFRRFAREKWRWFLHKHRWQDKELWEFPLSTWGFLGWQIPIAGGNYFRQLPHWLVKRSVDHWHRNYDAPFVMYFNVWELDAAQPMIHGASRLTRIRHYRNLPKMPRVLEDYFGRYRFTGIADWLGLEHQRPAPADAANGTRSRAPRHIDVLGSDGAPWIRPALRAPGAGETRTAVSVVVPCFNEELILPYLRNTLKSVHRTLGDSYELHFLFVDDGSADGTWQALNTIFGKWPNATLLRHEHNRGVAAAILTGIHHAQTEIVSSIDCDCTYDPHELRHMIPLLTDGVDLVTASPYHERGEVRNVPRWRLSLSKGASFLYRRVLRQKLATYTSCFRVYRRHAVIDLAVREHGYLGIAEMLALLDLRGSRIVEYPTTLEVRLLGRSKIKILGTIAGHLKLLVRLLGARLFQAVPIPAMTQTIPIETVISKPQEPVLAVTRAEQRQPERTTA